MGVHERMTGAERVAKRRAALRAQGLKPKQFWLPDVSEAKVRTALAGEAKIISRIDAATDNADYFESIRADVWDGEPDYDWGPEGPPEPAPPGKSRPE